MKNITLTVLVAFTVVLVGVGGVAAHGTDTDSDHDTRPENGSAADWATWMEQQMTEQMGADRSVQMQKRMGMSYEEMSEHMVSRQNGSMMDGPMGGGMSGMGCH